MTAAPGLQYRPDIDGLRAVAVLSVLGFHGFSAAVPGGFVGVDVFFVISGFLITTLIVKALDSHRFRLAEFYARRARRILPALIVVISACVAFGWLALLPNEFRAFAKHVVAAATFSSNFLLWQERGYFDVDSALKPFLHLWSLGIEEQFYLLWPLLLLWLWKHPRRLWVTVGALVAGSFVLNAVLVNRYPTETFYLPFTRFWELGFGCLLALAGTRWRQAFSPGRIHALSVIGLTLIIAAVFVFSEQTAFPGWRGLLPTIGAACIIAAGPNAWVNRRVLAQPGMVFIGLISYPLYLWHWPLLSFATILESGEPAAWIRASALLLSVALAWLTYLLIEVPVRTRRSLKVSLALTGGLATLGVAGMAIFMMRGIPARFSIELEALGRGARVDQICTDFFGGTPPFNYCRSTAGTYPDVLVLGDSHAQAIYDGAVAYFGDNHNVMLLADPGCPPLLDVDVYGTKQRERTRCRRSWTSFVQFAKQAKPSVVVLVGRGDYYFDEKHYFARAGVKSGAKQRLFREGLSDLVRELASSSSRVVYVLENPAFNSAPACFMRPFTLTQSHKCAPVQSRTAVEERMGAYRRIVFDVRAELPQLSVVDTLPLLCDSSHCYQKPPGQKVLYSDTDHLNPAGGRYVIANSPLFQKLRMALQTISEPPRG